jgi:hypothetical protein
MDFMVQSTFGLNIPPKINQQQVKTLNWLLQLRIALPALARIPSAPRATPAIRSGGGVRSLVG